MFRPRPTFALALILAPLLPKAQTFFYIDQVTVQPGSPTEQDAVEITLSGGLSSTRAHIVSTTYQLAGNTVLITVDAADNGGLTVIVPHNETIAIGSLSAGNWDIEIQGQHVLDLAPQPQHTFQVSGGAQNPCDSLQLVALRYAAFTDTALVAGLHNLGASFFNYPGLLLRNTGGDTLAIETVDLFGLVGESWHWLPIHPSSVLPAAPFPATLEVWVNFFDSLACAFPVVVEPCPQTRARNSTLPCTMPAGRWLLAPSIGRFSTTMDRSRTVCSS